MQSEKRYLEALERKQMKGQLNQLPLAAVSIAVFFMVTGLAVLILAGMNGATTNTDAQAVLGKGITAESSFADWGLTFVTVVAAGVIIALVFGYFYFGIGRGGRA